jgi:hypothetical protein
MIIKASQCYGTHLSAEFWPYVTACQLDDELTKLQFVGM